ncbi:MAG: T9SS type A sorting domain-containing protein [Saprospiraceae bacterium]|nr:T9SS type A sorting domain-containing protein [Saprospiraceae bacterium]
MKNVLLLLCTLSFPLSLPAQYCGPLHVHPGATGAGTGESWQDAFVHLQDAIDAAEPGSQIWVAAGTYLPQKDTTGNAAPTNARTKTFFINKDIQLYGGFAGTEQELWQRDPATNLTVLSGDLGTIGVATDNAYNVLHLVLVSPLCVIDGFTITCGNANGSGFNSTGGGILLRHQPLQYAAPVIRNCIIEHNNASSGGGFYTATDSWAGPSIRIEDCTFRNNTATSGGGIYFQQSMTTELGLELVNVEFSGQSISQYGGGLYANGHFTARHCRFENNSSNRGAGANIEGGTSVFENCAFISNTSLRNGGGLRIERSTSTLVNCLFLGNEANILNESSPTSNAGGGMFYRGSNTTFVKLANCVFSGNKGQNGAGFAQTTTVFNTSSAELDNCSFAGNSGISAVARLQGNLTIENSIIFGNAGTALTGGTARSCIIEGGYVGTGNLDVNPLFVNIPSHFLAPIATGNLKLQAGSPAIDQGNNSLAPLNFITDADGNHRMINCVVDRGAFEFGSPGPSDRICYADTDGDGWGNAAIPRLACNTCPGGFVSNNGDCDDSNSAITNTLPPPAAIQLSAEFCRGEPSVSLRSIQSDTPGRLVWLLVQAPSGSRFEGQEPLEFHPGAVNAEFSVGTDHLLMCSAPTYQGLDLNGVWVFEVYYETAAGCRSAAQQGFTVTVNRGAPQGHITASAERICPGDAVVLFFHTTDGAGPFDIVVNAQTYTGLTNGAAFDTLVSGTDFADSLVVQLSEISDGLSICQGDTMIVQELVLYTTPAVLFVHAAASPGGNGSAWNRAFSDLQDALEAAAACPAGIEIWVAQGTYFPDRGAGDRNASFTMSSNISLYGGFAGTETARDERNWTAHPTILSGDIGMAGDSTDNSYTVVTAIDVDSTALIDGFTIRDGHADGAFLNAFTPLNAGGGMYCNNSDFRVRHCTFQRNAAYFGGGLINHNSGNPTISQCRFLDNSARDSGGGLYNTESPRIDSSYFGGNRALFGGGIANQGFNSLPIVLHSEFVQNTAGNGGGVHNGFIGMIEFSHCSFIGNTASTQGGGVSNSGNLARLVHCRFEQNASQGNGGGFGGSVLSSAQLISCTFTGNTSGENGGGVYTNHNLVLHNCLLSGNRAAAGGGIYYNITSGLNVRLSQCTFGGNFADDRGGAIAVDVTAGLSNFSVTLENSILWGNASNGQGGQIWSSSNATLAFFFTCYANSPGDVAGQGTFSADAESITTDPLFLALLPASAAPVAGGNYRLSPCSPAIDAGNFNLIPAGITSDLDGNPRTIGAGVDMGAFETPDDQTVLSVMATVAAACFNSANGSATASVSGGVAPYNYQWSNGQTTATAIGLSAGAYVVTVSDAAGCVREIGITIPELPPLENLILDVQQPLCNTSDDGTVTASIAGGDSTYTFMWSNGQTGALASGLQPGTYSVTATDANGCTATETVTLTGQYQLFSSFTVLETLTCHGDSTAEVLAAPMGGVGPYQFQWSHGPQTALLSGLPAGIYHVTITDANGCTATGATVFTDPPALELLADSTPAACEEAADGTADAAVMGGMPPYTFLWSNGSNETGIENLLPGVYGVTVTDQLGCSASMEVEVLAGIFTPNLTVIQEGNILTALETDANYQWINCADGLPIPGATGHSFAPAMSGSYAVVLSRGACRDTSLCVEVMIVSTGEVEVVLQQAEAYPNPNDGQFVLRLPWAAALTLYDAAGRRLQTGHYGAGVHTMRIGAPAGVYWLVIQHAKGVQTIKIVRK